MDADTVRAAVADVLNPGSFYVRAESIRIDHHPHEQTAWEVFRGQLLDRTQTRSTKSFESWDVCITQEPQGLPPLGLIGIKYDVSEELLHVTRSIHVYAWEPYQEAGNVILTRETRRWVRELVGTIDLHHTADGPSLRQELAHLVYLAVVGTSRLPITSLESPLPAYSLGQFAYFHREGLPASAPSTRPDDMLRDALVADLSPLQRARLLETLLRTISPAQVPEMTDAFLRRWLSIGLSLAEIPGLVKTVFNHVALSPYTAFVDNLIAFLEHVARQELGPRAVIDTIGYLLRHLVRHLTAFDLVKFHNLGANYPDALALDVLLRAYLGLVELDTDAFTAEERACVVRRRALRQAFLIRKKYEGHPVPDLPTSPGENLRILPEPFVRIPDEQMLQPHRRQKRLFDNRAAEQLLTPNGRRVLEQSLHDLARPDELQELGMAVYLDRPLGVFKEPGEVDRTPLLSYEAFSRSVASRRLDDLVRWGLLSAPHHEECRRRLQESMVRGIPAAELTGQERPGVVALEDALKAAADFVFLHTTRSSLQAFLTALDIELLKARWPATADWFLEATKVLLIRSPRFIQKSSPDAFLTAFDEKMQPRIEFGVNPASGRGLRYVEHKGQEYLEQGLRMLWVGDSR